MKKDRDPIKARRRAKNDAATAFRKLAELADDVEQPTQAARLRSMADEVAGIAADLLGRLETKLAAEKAAEDLTS